MKKREPVSKIMTTDVVTVHHGDSLSKARRQFEEHHVHHLPVVSGEKLIGIISWNDLMRVAFGDLKDQDVRSLDAQLDHTYQLEEVMQSEPISIGANQTIGDAAQKLRSGDYHSLPVVNGENLVGIVTSSDLIGYLADLL